MANLDAIPNGVVASQERAIELDETANEQNDVAFSISRTLDQLQEDTDHTVVAKRPMSSTVQDELQGDPELAEEVAEHESPLFVSQGSPSSSNSEVVEALYPELIEKNGLAVVVPRLKNQWEYRRYDEPVAVVEILEEYDDGGLLEYLVQLDDESEEVVSWCSFISINSYFFNITCRSSACRYNHGSLIFVIVSTSLNCSPLPLSPSTLPQEFPL